MNKAECIRWRVQDIDFNYQPIIIRCGKGQKDRVVPLPIKRIDTLKNHLQHRKQLHESDLKKG